MDSTHDLGGKQGFGPIPIDDNEGFHHDWERRMWGISRSNVGPPGMIIDWFRHGIENMVPSDYLSFAYFNKWCTNYYMLLIDGGILTEQEAISGHAENSADQAHAMTVADAVIANQNANKDFSVDIDTAPRFVVGDTIATKRRTHSGHTRLPAYARNATGTVVTHHGAHLLADKGAQGEHFGEHLYTVSFTATELWGPDANPRDTVTLELWDSYIV